MPMTIVPCRVEAQSEQYFRPVVCASQGGTEVRVMLNILKPTALVILLILAPSAHAQDPGKVDMEAAELASELLGAPVLQPDGTKIGEVADISFDDNGRPDRLRVKTDKPLGLGTRTVELPKDEYMVLRGAVVVHLSVEALEAYPDIADRSDD